MLPTSAWPNADDLARAISAESGDTVLLAFSCGKDSLAAWLHLRRHFVRVVPFYRYLVPGLAFVEKSLAYYEAFFETPIVRLPQPALFKALRGRVLQPHDRLTMPLEDTPTLTHRDIERYMRERAGAPNAYVAIGSRMADSPMRSARIQRHGPVNQKERRFFAVYDWNLDRVTAEIQAAGVKLPVDYRLFGSTFDGLDYRYLAPIREHFPDDYAKILRWFPLAGADIARRRFAEMENAHGQA